MRRRSADKGGLRPSFYFIQFILCSVVDEGDALERSGHLPRMEACLRKAGTTVPIALNKKAGSYLERRRPVYQIDPTLSTIMKAPNPIITTDAILLKRLSPFSVSILPEKYAEA